MERIDFLPPDTVIDIEINNNKIITDKFKETYRKLKDL